MWMTLSHASCVRIRQRDCPEHADSIQNKAIHWSGTRAFILKLEETHTFILKLEETQEGTGEMAQ